MTTKTKLNQWVGIRKGAAQRATSQLSKHYHQAKKPGDFVGMHKKFEALTTENEGLYPDEKKVIQADAAELLRDVRGMMSDWINVVATCDVGNMQAKADVVVDGQTLLEDVPVPLLLTLEKRLKDLAELVGQLPVLDNSKVWTLDAASGQYRAEVIKRAKTERVKEPIVLVQATVEHPAQSELVDVNKVVGHWVQTDTSAALPAPEKRELLERIERVRRAIQFAVEQANDLEVEQSALGDRLMRYLIP